MLPDLRDSCAAVGVGLSYLVRTTPFKAAVGTVKYLSSFDVPERVPKTRLIHFGIIVQHLIAMLAWFALGRKQ